MYDTDENEETNHFDDMLAEGLMTDDCDEEYLKKLKLLEIRLKENVDTGHFRCKIQPANIYKQMTELYNKDKFTPIGNIKPYVRYSRRGGNEQVIFCIRGKRRNILKINVTYSKVADNMCCTNSRSSCFIEAYI